MNRTLRGSLTAMASALLALTALGGTAQAASLHVTFQATPSPCVQGTANGPFSLSLRDSSNHQIDHIDTVTPDGVSHLFDDCFPGNHVVKTGRRLVADNGSSTPVSFTIPTLTMSVDRVTDVVSGKGPANKQVKIRLFRCSVFDGSCVHKSTKTTSVNGAGKYSRDTSSFFNIHGYDRAHVTYTNTAGHTYTLDQRAPWMSMELDTDGVLGDLNPGQTAKFRLRTAPGGTVLKTRTVTQGGEGFSFTFGAPLSPGREVSGDFASDARIKIPKSTLTIDPPVGGDQIIHVRCLPNRRMMVDLNPGVDIFVMADDHGRATLNLSTEVSDGFVLTDEEIIVQCTTAAGDLVSRRNPPVGP